MRAMIDLPLSRFADGVAVCIESHQVPRIEKQFDLRVRLDVVNALRQHHPTLA
ncbi:hypothetical protein D3C87_1789110 [compost metagenome]